MPPEACLALPGQREIDQRRFLAFLDESVEQDHRPLVHREQDSRG